MEILTFDISFFTLSVLNTGYQLKIEGQNFHRPGVRWYAGRPEETKMVSTLLEKIFILNSSPFIFQSGFINLKIIFLRKKIILSWK